VSLLRTNFACFEPHDRQLGRLGTLAERYFPDDPNTCLLKLRQLTELLAQLVALSQLTVDGLRGSLHRFHAVKGTIITLGGFASGARQAAFEPGAAPTTLIDGEKLLDLLIDNGLGVRTKTIELLEFDEAGLEAGKEAE
jgi:hypothetical protein